MAGGGLVAMVVVQKVALGEGRALRGERFFNNNHGPRGGTKKITKRGVLRENSDLISHFPRSFDNKYSNRPIHMHTTMKWLQVVHFL